MKMGYDTTFEGAFGISPVLKPEHQKYLKAFSETCRVKRNSDLVKNLEDPIREAVGLPVGEDGGYFVNADGFMGQNEDSSVIDYNRPPKNQPSLWNQWIPSEDGTMIVWNEGEKFYDYVEWIQYLVDHFLIPWGYTLNGEVIWSGEEESDTGKIEIVDNKITHKYLV
ncbi:MAG: hypothetical protein ACOCUH_03720 [Bacteriovoracia bacterium]